MDMNSRFRGENQQHFSLRKLSVGVASVLIGTTFMVFGGHTVHADDLSRGTEQVESSVVQKQNDQNSAQQEVNASDQKQVSEDAKQVEAPSVNAENAKDQQVNANETSASQKQVSKDTNKVATSTFNVAKFTSASKVNADQLAASKVAVKQAAPVQEKEEVHYNNPINVYNWDGLTSAIRDKNVDAIVLNNDIYATGSRETAFNKSNDWDISRKLTITSKDPEHRNTINFGDHFFSFWDRNQRWWSDNNHPWNIVLKDINITNTDKAFSPFFFNNESVKEANRSTLTLDNVDQTGDMLLRSEQVNVVLKNNVNINDTLHNGDYNAIYARSVKIAPNANVVMNVRDDTDSWFLHGNAAIKIVGDGDENNVAVEVGNGASLKINPGQTVENTKGIVIEGNSDVILDKNADVEMNMGTGNTTAIWGARNLTLNEGSKLNIKTLQDNHGKVAWGSNNNGHHVSPISLGTNKVSWANNTLEIKKGASLKIVRENSGEPVIAGLISFGSYSSNAHSNQNLLVDDGAILDLQDGAQSDWHEYGDKLAGYLGDHNRLYNTGLISMYGIDATNQVHFGNAKYVNLQRTGYQHGILLRLEGGSSIGGNSAVIDAHGMPLKQWVAGNHSDKADYSWNVDYLKTENKWGDYSYNYNVKGQKRWSQYRGQRDHGVTFDQSNSSVKFTDGRDLVFGHGDFNRMFNWWAPQRLSFGTIYAIPTASVVDDNALATHVNANINQSPSLDASNIVLTWKDTDGNVVKAPEHYTITWVAGPNTSVATEGDNFDRSGKVEIIVDGEKQEVIVPVKVLSAYTKNNGAKVNQNDPSTLPVANDMANTSDVDRFGIDGINWSEEPNISEPNPQSYGKVRVDYSDGTSQIVNPYVDVRKVEDGRDHQEDKSLYITSSYVETYVDYDGNTVNKTVTITHYRVRYTDYKYPVGDSRRVTYSRWYTVK